MKMKLNLSKLRVPVMVVLVVTAMVGAPLFLPDSVSEQVSPVGDSEAIAPVVIPLGVAAVGGGAYGLYGAGYLSGVQDGDIDASGMTDQQFRNSVKARANANRIDQRKMIGTEIQDLEQSTYDRALSEANIEFVSAIEEGKSKSVAVVEAKASARDVIASEQILALEQWETQMLELRLINSDMLIQNSDNISDSDKVTRTMTAPNGDTIEYDVVNSTKTSNKIKLSHEQYDPYDLSIYNDTGVPHTKNIRLANGSEYTITTVKAAEKGGDILDPFDKTNIQRSGGINPIYPKGIIVYNQDIIEFKGETGWHSLGDYYDETESRVMTNLGTADDPDGYLSQVYNSWAAGTIESEEILTPYDYSRMSMETGSVGSQSWSNVQLATKGINANLSTSVVVETSDGSVVAGDLFSRSTPPNGSWEVGQTYNTSEYEHPFFMTTTVQQGDSTTGQIVKITGEFTVNEAYGSGGENVSTITPRDYTVSTTDTTELEQKINDLIEQNQELEEEMEQQSAISLGGGGDGLNPTLIIIVLLVLGGGALALQNQQPPRNRRRY